ncbi:insulin receptor substrate 1-like isoform X2 [Narcine bancroftii]|uniref:insulin receptor substrate 1-like isoform X2 n=1 Tax=Narcine bancroftii TaxID=1343680 RepID=UPI003831A1C2
MANPAEDCLDSDVKKCGNLRKSKSLHRRYFVLWAASERGEARLEYYDSEKKFRGRGTAPRRVLPLQGCFSVTKRADARSKYLVALYTRAECLAVAAESAQEQDSWYQAIVELLGPDKTYVENGDSNYSMAPGPAFKEVWQVNLRPRGLGQSRNMSGIYRLCLTEKTINLVKLNSDAAAVVLQLMNIRRCGHSDNFFFVEVGRSAVTGPGEFWMQVDDSVVAQNMHETILEAMKAMSEEFRLRSKSQSSSSNPISAPPRRYHLANLPPSQVGFSTRRGDATSPAQRCNSARARTSSDGSSVSSPSSRPASADEFPASTSPGAGLTPSQQGPIKAHPLLGQTRSTPDPSSRRSPCTVGLAPSLTADRGFSSPSASSSPPSSSDGEGELGSSPAYFPLEGHPRDYVALCGPAQPQQRQLLRRACIQGEEEPGECGLSKQAWPGKGSWPTSKTPEPAERGYKDVTDNGYMAMLPGVVPGHSQGGDYVTMTPKGASVPLQILGPWPADHHAGGYMLMSPSGSCSPEGWARTLTCKLGIGDGVSDYMNMSPSSRSASSTPPGSPLTPVPPCGEEGEQADNSYLGYRSLPRCYRQTATVSSSGQLSLSSSSSIGGSCDSLGEVEGRCPTSASAAGQQPPRLGRKCGGRQTGLSIDVAKANTLPRRRECPPESQSLGEYVSIEIRAEAHLPHTLPRLGPQADVFHRLPAPASQYVNLDLGQVPPGEHAAGPSPQGALKPTGFSDLSPDPHRRARVICADAQRRRRHCSETFLPVSAAPPPPVPCADPVRCCDSASFENVWPPADASVGSGSEEPYAIMSRHMSIGFENGLNYIDLDLGTDRSKTELSPLQRLYTQANSSPMLNAYASIDFHKSEELRSHKNNNEGTVVDGLQSGSGEDRGWTDC